MPWSLVRPIYSTSNYFLSDYAFVPLQLEERKHFRLPNTLPILHPPSWETGAKLNFLGCCSTQLIISQLSPNCLLLLGGVLASLFITHRTNRMFSFFKFSYLLLTPPLTSLPPHSPPQLGDSCNTKCFGLPLPLLPILPPPIWGTGAKQNFQAAHCWSG